MVTTYAFRHEGPNGMPEVCEEQIKYLEKIGRNFEVIDWPRREGMGEYSIPRTKESLNFSELKFPAIFLNGQGVLHGRTFFLVDAIKKDLHYFHIDQHGDLRFENEKKVDCASHAFKISELDHVRKMTVLGLNPFCLTDELGFFDGDEDSGQFNFCPSPALNNPKIEFHIAEPWRESRAKFMKIKSTYIDKEGEIARIEKYAGKYLDYREFNPNSSQIPHAYVSIDLDVVGDFPSGWRGGLWPIEKVIESIKKIGESKQIIGADICGLDLSNYLERVLSKKRKQKALEDVLRVHDTFLEVMASPTRRNF